MQRFARLPFLPQSPQQLPAIIQFLVMGIWNNIRQAVFGFRVILIFHPFPMTQIFINGVSIGPVWRVKVQFNLLLTQCWMVTLNAGMVIKLLEVQFINPSGNFRRASQIIIPWVRQSTKIFIGRVEIFTGRFRRGESIRPMKQFSPKTRAQLMSFSMILTQNGSPFFSTKG